MSGESTTPSGARIVAHLPSGEVPNITEGVQALYDLVIQSLDWGSGFLSLEEVEPVARLAEACGFEGWEEAQRYAADEQHKREQQVYWEKNVEAARAARGRFGDPPASHEHVFSSVGRCMWRGCGVTNA